MFYRIQQTPEVGDILHARTMRGSADVASPRLDELARVEVLEVFASVCRVKSCDDGSTFRARCVAVRIEVRGAK